MRSFSTVYLDCLQGDNVCISCVHLDNCALYMDGEGNNAAAADVAQVEQLCPAGSTYKPVCMGCAIGYFGVGVKYF